VITQLSNIVEGREYWIIRALLSIFARNFLRSYDAGPSLSEREIYASSTESEAGVSHLQVEILYELPVNERRRNGKKI